MEIILAFFIFLVVVIGMSIGVIMGRKPISGSCGGIGAALGEDDYVCDICGGDPDKCENSESTTDSGTTGLAYNADRKPAKRDF